VHVVDLETGRDHVVRHGQAGESFFVAGGAVVWTESPDSKTPPEFLAAAAESGRRQTTPIALRRMVGAAGLVTDGKATAFCDPTWRSVWWSPRLDVRPRRVITSPTGHFVVNSLQVVGHYLAFTVAPFTYLADTATHRYVQIGPGGWVLLDDEHLVMMMPSRQKATHGITDVVCVPLSELPPVGSAR
jgi:hypothetical protein